jgi:hypothetical protein
MGDNGFYVAIDIGAGNGTKIAICRDVHSVFSEVELHLAKYGKTFEEFLDALTGMIEQFLAQSGIRKDQVRAYGVSTAGILRSDGSFQLVQNLPHFNGHNLKRALREYFHRPVAIENDANAGGLAEWSVLQVEMLYWVLGGGWGGAWISRDGRVLHPTVDWDGADCSLHYTNEPGYSIPLDKLMLKQLFAEVGTSFERFEMVLQDEMGCPVDTISGPGGNGDTLRAEVIISGPGRCRLFRAIVGDDDFYERFLDIHETREMSDPSIAGRHISKLSSMRVEAAVNTDRLYGKILAIATRTMLKSAIKEGMPEGVPICLGGKPSYALPYFGPSSQRLLGKFGLMNYLRPSVIDERGSNANVVGAAFLAKQADDIS